MPRIVAPDTNETFGWTFDLDEISANVYKIIVGDSGQRWTPL